MGKIEIKTVKEWLGDRKPQFVVLERNNGISKVRRLKDGAVFGIGAFVECCRETYEHDHTAEITGFSEDMIHLFYRFAAIAKQGSNAKSYERKFKIPANDFLGHQRNYSKYYFVWWTSMVNPKGVSDDLVATLDDLQPG
jgi:hypothetical protein